MSSVWTVRRSTSDAKVAGVCGGVARQWGVDPVLVRVGCALLALSGGIGVVLYVAGWLLLPREGQDDPAIFDMLGPAARQWSREVWLVLVGIGCLATFVLLAPLTPFGVGPAAILALVWYFGYYKHSPNRGGLLSTPRQPPPSLPASPAQPPYLMEPPNTPFAHAAHAWRARVSEVHGSTGTPAGSPPPSARALPRPGEEGYEPVGPASALTRSAAVAVPVLPRTTRASSESARRLRLVAMAVLALTVAGLYVADRLGVAVPVAGYLSAALLVLGLTLVAAAWLGRARGLLPLALLVLLATVATTVTGPVARSVGWESERRSYASAGELARGDHQRLGRLQVDLRPLRLSSDATYTASVGVGALEVSVPADTNVVVNWGFRAGAVVVDDTEVNSGGDRHGTQRISVRSPNSKTLVLNLSVGQGVVQVRR